MLSLVRIEIPQTEGAPEIELIGSPQAGLESRFWAALLGARVVPAGSYVIRHEDRLILHAKLFERDGSPVSTRRALRLMRDVRRCLTCSPESSGACLDCPTRKVLADWSERDPDGESRTRRSVA